MTEFNMPKSRVYVLADDRGRVVRCEGEYTLPEDLTGWTLIDEGCGDRYNLAQSHYFPEGLFTGDGIPMYELEGDLPVLREKSEIQNDRQALPGPGPTQMDRIEAQLTYTAMMTDTLLEE